MIIIIIYFVVIIDIELIIRLLFSLHTRTALPLVLSLLGVCPFVIVVRVYVFILVANRTEVSIHRGVLAPGRRIGRAGFMQNFLIGIHDLILIKLQFGFLSCLIIADRMEFKEAIHRISEFSTFLQQL